MDLEENKYWLALNGISGLGVNGQKALIEAFGTPRGVFSASVEALCSITGIGKTIAQRICRYNDWSSQTKALAYYEKEKISLLTWKDLLYPPLL